METPFDKLGEECGIFGGYCTVGDAAPYIRSGLFKLQHRGQESAGMSTGDVNQTLHKAKGLVTEVLTDTAMQKLSGAFGIGHVRYSIHGGTSSVNAQPYLINYLDECVSIANNGNIKKAAKIRKKFECIGEVFITNSDSEVVLKRIVYGLKKPPSEWTFEEVAACINKDFSKGSFSLLLCLPEKIFAYRDPLGYRPLVFCEAKQGYFLASEDVAFSMLDVINITEIKPGEGVEITRRGWKIQRYAESGCEKKCVFEHIYFANPASNIFGRNVYQTRVELGKHLARNDVVKPDIVVPVMDSGFSAAIGYSQESGVPLEMGLLRNHWVGRSFIQPTRESRIKKVREKLLPIKSVLEGKIVALIDDSLVRGTTSIEIINMLKSVGVKEVHFRLSSPMILNTCDWGVDIPTKEELIATKFNGEVEIARAIGADSVGYLGFSTLKEIFGSEGWCYKCFKADKAGTKGFCENECEKCLGCGV